MFVKRRSNLNDKSPYGRPSTVNTTNNTESVIEMIRYSKTDHRVKIRVNISYGLFSIFAIIHVQFSYSKICARLFILLTS